SGLRCSAAETGDPAADRKPSGPGNTGGEVFTGGYYFCGTGGQQAGVRTQQNRTTAKSHALMITARAIRCGGPGGCAPLSSFRRGLVELSSTVPVVPLL